VGLVEAMRLPCGHYCWMPRPSFAIAPQDLLNERTQALSLMGV